MLSTAEHISVAWFHFPRGNLAVTKQVSFIVLTQPGSEPVWRQVWEKMLEKEKRRVGGRILKSLVWSDVKRKSSVF